MALETSLEHYFYFDSDANDKVGTNDGAVSGPVLVTGKLNDGYDFNGGSDKISLIGVSFLDHLNPWTISCWIKPESWNDTVSYIFLNRSGDDAVAINFKVGEGLGIRLYDYGTASNVETIGQSETPSTGSWHHITAVHDGAGNVDFYVNNSLKIDNITIAMHNKDNAFIGSNNFDDTFTFNGIIDEVAIWSRALSLSEVADLYNSGTGKFYDHTDNTFSATPTRSVSSVTTVKIYDGITWNDASVKVRRSGSWVPASVKVRRSGSWV